MKDTSSGTTSSTGIKKFHHDKTMQPGLLLALPVFSLSATNNMNTAEVTLLFVCDTIIIY